MSIEHERIAMRALAGMATTDLLSKLNPGKWCARYAAHVPRLLDEIAAHEGRTLLLGDPFPTPSVPVADPREVMTVATFRSLKLGDIVRAARGDLTYIVTATYGTRVTAVRSVDLTNPSEWVLVSSAHRTS